MSFDATARRSAGHAVLGKGDAGSVLSAVYTYELASSTVGTTFTVCRVPSTARFLGSSKVYVDDCATTGAPVLTFGLKAVDSNLVNSDDPDALGNSVTLATAGAYDLVSNPANIGKQAWELVASETVDPGGFLDVTASIITNDTTTTGTVAVEPQFTLD